MKKIKNKTNYKNNKALNILMVIISMIITLGVLLTGTTSGRTNLKVNNISDKKIKAPRNIENVIATEKLKKEAYDSVVPVYKKDSSISKNIKSKLDNFFEIFENLKKEYLLKKDSILNIEIQIKQLESNQVNLETNQQLTEEEINANLKIITDNLNEINKLEKEKEQKLKEIYNTIEKNQSDYDLEVPLSTLQIQMLLELDEEIYLNFKENLNFILNEILEGGAKQESNEKSLLTIKEKLERLYPDSDIKTLGYDVLSFYLEPNVITDFEATEKLRVQKQEEVEPKIFLKNQTIVDEGQMITTEIFQVLKDLGLTEENYINNIWYVIGSLIIVIIIFIVALYFLYLKEFEDVEGIKQKIMLFILYNLAVIVIWLLKEIAFYYIPISLFILLAAVLINSDFAIIFNIILSTIILIVTKIEFEFYIYFILSGTIISLLGSDVRDRNKILVSGLLASIFNFVILFGISILIYKNYSKDYFFQSLFVFANCLISVVVAVGSLPFWESFFGISTNISLLDLTNPSNELLRRLTIEAPGTYHHSLIVSNLAESAAIEIGANPIVARIGGYYHDIGKLKFPNYFSENQSGINPHDYLDPYESARIIKEHVSYGIELAEKHKLPSLVKDMIGQHHGNTIIKYFYYKAMENNPDKEINEDDFRYPGKTPEYKEVAIIMLADTVEAAVRSVAPQGKSFEEIETLVRKLVLDKFNDNQLVDSNLIIKDIDEIICAFVRVFKGMYHDRISYPEEKEKLEKIEKEKIKKEEIKKEEIKKEEIKKEEIDLIKTDK